MDIEIKSIKLPDTVKTGKVLNVNENNIIESTDVNVSDVKSAILDVTDLKQRVSTLETSVTDATTRLANING